MVAQGAPQGKTLKAGGTGSPAHAPDQVVLLLVAGDVVTYRSGPRGHGRGGLLALLFPGVLCRKTEFLFTRPGEFEGIPAGAPTLEGFLFPDTYTVTRSMTAREILSAMTRQFARRLPPDFAEKAKAASMGVLEATTLASLVEKETALNDERPVVAGVYRNRLKAGMLLQCDPTTIYALKRLGRWRGSLARSELTVDEPYNTYVRPGLPPGPICNPGLASLRSAVSPADVDYRYFVAAGDGSHLFSREYEDQQRNAARYHEAKRAARADRAAP